jgi:ribosome biogenesis GTPase A
MKGRGFWKIVDDVIEQVDLVLEICDARLPELTRNKRIEYLTKKKRKKLLIVFNKVDLVDEKTINELRKVVKEDFVFVSCKKRFGFARLRKIINFYKGQKKEIRVGVVGYPNTGKSSIINALVGRRKALTSSIAGFTKGVQWITDHKGLLLYDTPGVIPIDENDEVRKAIISAVSPQNIKYVDLVAQKIIEMFLSKKDALEKLYGIQIRDENPEKIIEMIGEKKNYFKKGGGIDINRACVKIINDWQKGRLRLK